MACALLLFGLGCAGREAPLPAPASPALAASAAPVAVAPRRTYPPAPRDDVEDTYPGLRVADPYRWLEDARSAETRAWLEAQGAQTRAFLDGIPARAAIRDRLQALWDHERLGVPFHQGGRYFWTANNGRQRQSVLMTAARLDEQPQVLLDPNEWSADGSVALRSFAVDEQARFLAYGLSEGGSDWITWRIRDLRTGRDLPDELRWTRYSGVSWLPDGTGLFYSRYPAPGPEPPDPTEHNKLYFHRLGTSQAHDLLVFEDPDHPRRSWSGRVSEDGRHLFITGQEGTAPRSRLYVLPLRPGWTQRPPGQGLVRLLDEFDAGYYPITDQDGRLWLWTNKDAPNGRVIAVDLTDPRPERWVEVVPPSEDVLEYVNRVGDQLVLTRLRDAHARVELVGLQGGPARPVILPGLGSVSGFLGDPDRDETFFSFTSFTEPPTIYRLDARSGAVTRLWRPTLDIDPQAFETRQLFVRGRDGTRIPVFLTQRRGRPRDGDAPVLLYAYGGFGVSLTPWFSVSHRVWMELGGIFAVANLRGGGEYGEPWHRAATGARKQVAVDDLIAVSEQLVALGYTRPGRLAIHGASNGGLVVAAALVQRPELFGAALPASGVLDLLRYHRWGVGWAWAEEYGTSEDPALVPALRALSPLHNLRPGTSYPATLISTGAQDDRVAPAHSYKFAAALQHAQAGPAPILLRVEEGAGHGAGQAAHRVVEELADRYAFLVAALGMDLGPRPLSGRNSP